MLESIKETYERRLRTLSVTRKYVVLPCLVVTIVLSFHDLLTNVSPVFNLVFVCFNMFNYLVNIKLRDTYTNILVTLSETKESPSR